MKKFLKIMGYTVLSLVVLVYLCFLFVLPNVIKIEKYKPQIQKLVLDSTNLKLNFENAKVITTPLLGVGFKADNISVKLPDNSTLFSSNSIKARVALPSIMLLTVKVSCLDVDSPFVNLEIVNDDNFKVVKLIEKLLNQGKEQKLESEGHIVKEDNSNFQFDPKWIRIKVPNARLFNYRILVNDLKSKHFLDLKGDELSLGYFNGKTAKLKTYAELFSDENKNITANIDINTFLPEFGTKLDEEDDPAERIDILFINPVTMYRNYDLRANLDTKLRIRNHNNNLSSYGHFNIENVTLKISHLELPASYFRAKTFGTNVDIDTNIYPIKNQNISLLGKLNYGKHPKLDMKITTGTIQFNDVVILAKAILDSLHIRNELGGIKAYGYLNANCYIKTNLKKWYSEGSILVKDGGVSVRNLGKILSDGNINVKLDNNILDIRNSSILIGKSPLYIDGKIDEKSVAKIRVKADKIPLPSLFNAFAPKNLRTNYNFKSGFVTLDLNISGKLKEAIAGLKFMLSNLNISDKNINITNQNLNGEFLINSKEQTGKITNNNLNLYIPKKRSSISIPKTEIQIADNNINIKENSILLNNKTNLKYSGNIVDYTKLKSINFLLQGNLNTDDLIKLIGNEFKPFIHSKGSIPLKVTVEGDKNKQTLFAQGLCNKENFITPVELSNISGKDISLQSVIDFKEKRIKIKKTGLFERIVNIDEKGNEVIHLKEVFAIDGTIEGNRINLIKITIPETLKGKIYVFPQSMFILMKGRAYIFGEMAQPRMRGGFDISNLSIPELMLTLRDANLDFKGHSANLSLKDLILNESDIQLD